MKDFIVTNKTDREVLLPAPVSYTIGAHQSVNLADPKLDIPAEYIEAIKVKLNALEQAGTIEIQGVDDDVSSIGTAASGSGDIHPLVIKDSMAEEKAIQIPLWNGVTGSVNVALTLKLCMTDSAGSPNILTNRAIPMTITASPSSCKLNGTNSNIANVSIVNGMAEFTALTSESGEVNFAITGAAVTNVVTGEAIDVYSPYTVTFS